MVRFRGAEREAGADKGYAGEALIIESVMGDGTEQMVTCEII